MEWRRDKVVERTNISGRNVRLILESHVTNQET